MRSFLLLALVACTPAMAASSAPPPTGPLPRVGIALDAGLPGGAGVVLQARLLDALRVNAGPMWSGVGYGLKGGLLLSPLRTAVAPTLELEIGYGRADLSFLTRMAGVPAELRPVLARSSYRYASALVGLDLGPPRRMSLFVRAGVSWIGAQAPGTATTSAGGGTLRIGDGVLRATIPSAKVGLQFWF
jgi:hypothetical protein